MQTVFVRHNLDAGPETLNYLWNKHLIAIHFQDIRSVNPDDYASVGKQALQRLLRYCQSGAVVGASFRKIKSNQMLIGEIRKGSQVDLLDVSTVSDSDRGIYKVVQLVNVKEVSYSVYPLLAAIQPRQGTITGWPSAEKYLLAILRERELARSVKSLHPSQLEVICYEFLKMRGILKALLLPIGRGLIDIDIYGLGESGERVLAQVTHSTNRKVIRDKLTRLQEYQANDSNLIFFAPKKSEINDAAIQHIAIEKVFSVLSKEKGYCRMISEMLNW